MSADVPYAFPLNDHTGAQFGMTLRDSFAAHALTGLLASMNQPDSGDQLQAIADRLGVSDPKTVLAGLAFSIADEMLAARVRGLSVSTNH